MDCAAFEERLPAWLEGQLDDEGRTAVERHVAECAACAVLVSDLDALVHSARALPVLTPSRDLWSGIEARLTAPVIPLPAHRDDAATLSARQRVLGGAAHGASAPSLRSAPSIRWFAMAATVLVAVTSGVTWTVAGARYMQPGSPGATATATATAPAAGVSASISLSTPLSNPANVAVPTAAPAATVASSERRVASEDTPSSSASGNDVRVATPSPRTVALQVASMEDVDVIYEREIAALRQIVNKRFASLDTATVSALRQNLETIDRAIADSRRALARDPNSGLLASELDRTLEAKLALMRRVALL